MKCWKNIQGGGYEIVYGVRNRRDKDSLFKRYSAELFYKFMQFLGTDTVFNHADYRLMSKHALEGLAQFKEVNLFLRGLVPLVGYQSDKVYYDRKERLSGESKYPLIKMISFALEGITSLSTKPLSIIAVSGFCIFLFSLLMLCFIFLSKIFDRTVAGWSSILISVWAMGGLQLFAIGVVGEYIGKIYLETKCRPKWILQDILHSLQENPEKPDSSKEE